MAGGIMKYATTTVLANPIVISKLRDEKKLNKGDHLALLGIGSGLNCTMAHVVW
jgi:3-oxoacyl-[acyl-carrier-protein] synthase III